MLRKGKNFRGPLRSHDVMEDSEIPNKTPKTKSDGSGDVNVDNSCSVLVKIATLYAEKLMNDLCLVVGGKEYPCHRLILCASSEVFQVMLMNPQWSESSESRVVLGETKECCEIFGDFLKYFYTGQIRINLQSVMSILLLADKYNVKDLVKLCIDYMCSHIAQAAINNSLISWLQYTHHCGHTTVAKASRNFVKWNLEIVANTQDFGNFEPNVFISLLQETDLVVYNEMRLYQFAVNWLGYQKDKFTEESDMEQLVTEVMSNIRFPMMSPRQLAELLLSPLTKKYKEFFVERMAIGMSFHSGQTERIKEVLMEEDGHLLFTPRLYTADTHSTLLTVENYSLLPAYYTSTLVFSSYASLADHAGDRTCEWVVDVYPKGVWFKKFYLIVWQGTLEVPEHVLRTVRLSITCKDPPPAPADVRVKIGIAIYGTQNDIEHIMYVHEINHYFSETEKVLNLDDLLSFEQLNSLGKSGSSSEFLVGPSRDSLKIHIVIEPLNDLLLPSLSEKTKNYSPPSLKMDENLSRGYIQLGKNRAAHDLRFNNGFSHLSPPRDKFNGVYFALVLAGVGFLLPYNSFTIAVDYFQSRYPGTTIVFDISLVYILMAFFAVLGNNILVETLTLNARITFGYLISFVTLLFVVIFGEIWWEIFGPSTTYIMTLVAVAVVALGCTVQQSSFYGYTSMLPSRYTQAVMAGESAAGLLVSVNRIITKSLLNDQRLNTLIFFLLSTFMIAVCFALYRFVNRTDFVQFYVSLCKESKKITLEPKEDIGLMDPTEQSEPTSQYGILKLNSSSACEYSTAQYSSLSFANPVYEPRGSGMSPSYKVEDIVLQMNGNRKLSGTWRGLKKGLHLRWEVAKCIWPYMLTIGFAYFITLCLYPGIESEIVSCRFNSWMPVIIMGIFNASDLGGKIFASVFNDWSRTNMLVFAGCRILLIPLILLCAMPRGHPYISGEGYPMLFSLILGLTNGLIGSIPMIQAPSKVSEENRELTGNIMTFSYNIGLTAGSAVAYVLDAILGEKNPNFCENNTFTGTDLPENFSMKPTVSALITATILTTVTADEASEISHSPTNISLTSTLSSSFTTLNASIV